MVKYILMIDPVREDKSFSDLRMQYPIIESALREIEKAQNETKNDRKNMLMLFRARIRKEGSISQLAPEILLEIAAHIPTLRSKDYVYQGWKLVDSYESGNTMLLRYYDLSHQMGKLTLDEPSTSHGVSPTARRKRGT
jgi:hypothetical protein